MYKVMVTGHRPQKLPLDIHNAIKLALLERVQVLFEQHDDLVLISGMALGVDTWFAEIGIKLGIPVIAVIPFKGQDSRWRKVDRQRYNNLLDAAESVETVADSFSYKSYFDRNTRMVEMSNECIAVWNGSPSGTSHAVEIAKSHNIPVDRIDPRNFIRMRKPK